jgi:hypothetical protein
MGAATIATDHVNEGFHPDVHQASQHNPGRGSSTLPAASASTMPEEDRRSSKPHFRATYKHSHNPSAPPPWWCQHSNNNEEEGGAPTSAPPQLLLVRRTPRPQPLQAATVRSDQRQWHPAPATAGRLYHDHLTLAPPSPGR